LALTWHAWLRAEIARYPSARAFAAALGIDDSQLSRWGRPYIQQPTPADLKRLALVTGTPLPDILMMLFTALEDRQRLADPSPAPVIRTSSRRRRRVVGGLIVVATSGWLSLAPPSGVVARPITERQYLAVFAADSRDSVASRRKAA
jgi:hypothetical protein